MSLTLAVIPGKVVSNLGTMEQPFPVATLVTHKLSCSVVTSSLVIVVLTINTTGSSLTCNLSTSLSVQ